MQGTVLDQIPPINPSAELHATWSEIPKRNVGYK